MIYASKIKIYFWPDGFWCWEEELEECLVGRSDDFSVIWVPEEVTYDHNEDFIQNLVNNTLGQYRGVKMSLYDNDLKVVLP